jgi:hypothetical protein
MTERLPFAERGRQPDPQPPAVITVQEPSLLVYLVLGVFATALIVVAFGMDKPDWPSLFLNLATEIVGAVILLIIIDRRLRESELRAIRRHAGTVAVRLAGLFSKEISTTVSYAQVFGHQLRVIKPEPYLERPALETLLNQYPKGFILHGAPGAGKSTLIQVIAASQAEKVTRQPRRELVPILLPMRSWVEGDLLQQVWEEMGRYFPVSRRLFHRWLEQGRVLLIFDSLDEHRQPELAFKEIERLRDLYPGVVTIVSCRRELDDTDLPKIEMPGLTEVRVQESLECQLSR